MAKSLSFLKPFNAHDHFRNGVILWAVIRYACENFFGSIVMPNLVPGITTSAMADDYRDAIEAAARAHEKFTPFMTIYLTDETDPNDLAWGFKEGIIHAAKLYPQHGTTNSAQGVTDYRRISHVLRMMEELGIPILIHAECPVWKGEVVDHFERESLYMTEVLPRMRDEHPNLRMSIEHISTAEGAEYIRKNGCKNVVSTITPHHLAFDRRRTTHQADAACMPIVKARYHWEALRDLVASGCEWVHLGTDCAPHVEESKLAVTCACGCFTGPHAIPLYLGAFEEMGCLDLFEEFASARACRFFGIKQSDEIVTYEQFDWQVEKMVEIGPDQFIRPLFFRTPEEVKRFGTPNLTLRWRKVT